jgi:hypothetical protein
MLFYQKSVCAKVLVHRKSIFMCCHVNYHCFAVGGIRTRQPRAIGWGHQERLEENACAMFSRYCDVLRQSKYIMMYPY